MTTTTRRRTMLTRAAAATAAMGAAALLGAAPASAVSWNDCWEGYAGNSWYTSSTGVGHALSQEGTNGCSGANLGVSIRYYGGGTTAIWTSNKQIQADRAVVPSGGYHWSRNGAGTNVSSL